MSAGTSPAIPISQPRGGPLTTAEYKPARRDRIRAILIDVAVGVTTNVLVAALTAMAHLLF